MDRQKLEDFTIGNAVYDVHARKWIFMGVSPFSKDYGRESRSVTVKLLLDGKVISSDTVSL